MSTEKGRKPSKTRKGMTMYEITNTANYATDFDSEIFFTMDEMMEFLLQYDITDLSELEQIDETTWRLPD